MRRSPKLVQLSRTRIADEMAAENSASDRQLMVLYDWTSEKQANTYAAAANRKRLAADAAKLSGDQTVNTELLHRTAPPKNSSGNSNP